MPVIDTPMLIEEAAEYLHTSQDSLREMAESGDVPAAKIAWVVMLGSGALYFLYQILK